MCRFETSETLKQVGDFEHPTLIDVFAFERIFDSEGFPFVADTPTAYSPEGPQMELGYFPTQDMTNRKEHGAIINFGERDNAMRNFNKTMELLGALRSGYAVAGNASTTPYFSMSDALKVAHMGIELPRYLLWKKFPEFENGELPPETILLNRALRGFHGLLRSTHHGLPQDKRIEFMQAPYSAQYVAQHILDRNALEANLSCVASWRMVEKMLLVMSGEDQIMKPATQEFGFTISELLNFSRSMRSVWDSVFPGLEHALSMAESRTGTTQEIQQQLGKVMLFTNLATECLGNAIGQDRVSPIELPELSEGFISYAVISERKDDELNARIDQFAYPTQI